MERHSIILSAYREAVLEMSEKGLGGQQGASLAIRAAAKIASRLLHSPVSEQDVVNTLGRV